MSRNMYVPPSGIPEFTYALSGHHICIPGEDPAEFESLLAGISAEMKPTGEATQFLVEEMAQCQWKIRRSAVILRDHFCFLLNLADYNTIANAYQRDAAGVQSVTKIARYENLLRRAWRECYKLLLQNRTRHNSTHFDTPSPSSDLRSPISDRPASVTRQNSTHFDTASPSSDLRTPISDLPASVTRQTSTEIDPPPPSSELRSPTSDLPAGEPAVKLAS